MQLLDVPKCKDLSVTALKEQIELRRKLINQMVGSLYPRILEDEIEKLQEYIERLETP